MDEAFTDGSRRFANVGSLQEFLVAGFVAEQSGEKMAKRIELEVCHQPFRVIAESGIFLMERIIAFEVGARRPTPFLISPLDGAGEPHAIIPGFARVTGRETKLAKQKARESLPGS